jgi:hypothetical protein
MCLARSAACDVLPPSAASTPFEIPIADTSPVEMVFLTRITEAPASDIRLPLGVNGDAPDGNSMACRCASGYRLLIRGVNDDRPLD